MSIAELVLVAMVHTTDDAPDRRVLNGTDGWRFLGAIGEEASWVSLLRRRVVVGLALTSGSDGWKIVT
jgi:hypothetical protein